QIDALQRNRSVTVDVDADTTTAEAQIDAVQRDRKTTIEVGADTAGATAQIAALNAASSSSGRSMRGLVVAALALGPALVPVTAAVGGLVAALSAPLAAAGGGMTVWGLLAGGAVKTTMQQYKEIAELRKKLGGLEKGTKEYAEAQKKLKENLSALTPAQKKFMNALDGIKTAMSGLVAGKAGQALLGPLSQGLNILSVAMRRSKPLIIAVGGALSELLAGIGRAVRGPAFKSFIGWFAKAAPGALKGFAAILGNIAVGLGGLGKAFAPLGESLMKSLVGLTARFASFGKTADSNSGVKGFMDYVREVGPIVSKFFGDFIVIVVDLGKALAPIGAFILKAFGWLANALKRIPTEVLTATAAGIIAVTVATKAMNLVMAANPVGVLIGALVALGVGLVYAYKHSEKFRKIVNKAWRGIKKAAQVTWAWMKGTLWPGIKQVFGWIGKRASWLWKNAIQPAFKAIWKFISTQLMPIVRRLWHKVIKPAFKGIGVVIRDAWNGIIKPTLKALWWFIRKVLVPVIRWLWKNVVKPVFKFIGKAIAFAWKHVIKPTLYSLIDFISKVVFPVIRWLYNKVVKPVFKGIGRVISFAWHKVIRPAFGFLKQGFEAVGGVFKRIGKMISGVWDGIKSGATSAVNWVIDRLNDFIGATNKAIDGLNNLPKVD